MTVATEQRDLQAVLLDRIKAMPVEQRRKLLALATPRIVEPYVAHIPHPKQQVFLSIREREAVYGGSAGGGKSDALLMAALQYVDVPGYSALLLRRTWPDLNSPGAILDRARTWLSSTGAHEGDGGRRWTFPSGARLSFGYIQHDKDVLKFQSAEYQMIGFDELTQFSEKQYTYMFSRIRRPDLTCLTCGRAVRKYTHEGWRHTDGKGDCGDLYPDPKVLAQYPPSKDGMTIFDVPLRMRGATNPGGPGHDWVRARFIDQRTRESSAFFVPAKLADNPSLDQASYMENLSHLTVTDRERLLNGDWDILEQGEMFQRHWFSVVNDIPTRGRSCRYWDKAATEGDGDWTVGVKLFLSDEGRWYVDDVVRGQWSSLQVENVIRATAAIDGNIPVVIEQEPGSSGKDVIDHYRRNVLVGYHFIGQKSTGSKADRAVPFASAAEAGNVMLKAANWNRKYLDELTTFPFGTNDDMVDASSGAMNYLAFRQGRVLV